MSLTFNSVEYKLIELLKTAQDWIWTDNKSLVLSLGGTVTTTLSLRRLQTTKNTTFM